MSNLITSDMRNHVKFSTYDHFGFHGYRAAIACLYARPGGASQDEVNEAAAELGSPQKGYYNMLPQAQRWGHRAVEWDHATRGHIFKLIFNPLHTARTPVAPPANWAQMNQTPHGVKPAPYRRVSRKKAAI